MPFNEDVTSAFDLRELTEEKNELPLQVESFEEIPLFGTEALAADYREGSKPSEDVVINIPESGLFGVFDGAGGVGGGEIASRETATETYNQLGPELDAVIKFAQEQGEDESTIAQLVEDAFVKALIQANQRVKDASTNPQTGKSGLTTFSVSKIVGNKAYFLNIGDSRIYQRDQAGNLERLTSDDGFFQNTIDQGYITSEVLARYQAVQTKEEYSALLQALEDEGNVKGATGIAYAHSNRNIITAAVGNLEQNQDVEAFLRARFESRTLKSGDQLVLISDGFEGLRPDEINAVLSSESDPRAAEVGLQKAAKGLEGRFHFKDDDKGVVVTEAYRPPEKEKGAKRQEGVFDLIDFAQDRYNLAVAGVEKARAKLGQLEGSEASVLERSSVQVEVARAQTEQAEAALKLLDRQVEQAQSRLRKRSESFPPRFGEGSLSPVRYEIPSDDGEGLVTEAKVVGFDAETNTYTIDLDGLGEVEVNRFVLEAQQDALPTKSREEIFPQNVTLRHRGKWKPAQVSYTYEPGGGIEAVTYTLDSGDTIQSNMEGHYDVLMEHMRFEAEQGAKDTETILASELERKKLEAGLALAQETQAREEAERAQVEADQIERARAAAQQLVISQNARKAPPTQILDRPTPEGRRRDVQKLAAVQAKKPGLISSAISGFKRAIGR